MIKILIKVVAIFLLYQMVIKPLFLGVAGRAAAGIDAVEKTFWWMSPGANGW